MPQCPASGEHCEHPELPIDGTCHVCKQVLHALCAARVEEADSTRSGAQIYCRSCNESHPGVGGGIGSVSRDLVVLDTPGVARARDEGEDEDAGEDSPFVDRPLSSPQMIIPPRNLDRNLDLFANATYYQFRGSKQFTESDMELACQEIAQQECGLDPYGINGNDLNVSDVKSTSATPLEKEQGIIKKTRQLRNCAFSHESACKWPHVAQFGKVRFPQNPAEASTGAASAPEPQTR